MMEDGFQLENVSSLHIQQRKELAELFGFETRNKFEILGPQKQPLGFAAEQGRGIGAFLGRYFLGHWRTFEIHFFDTARKLEMIAVHPWRFYFQKLEILGSDRKPIGGLQQRFSLLSKRFDVLDEYGRTLYEVSSPLWKPWTFSFLLAGRMQAQIKKKWSGFGKELFLDADNFILEFTNPTLPLQHRKLLLAAGMFIDLQYFEKKSSR